MEKAQKSAEEARTMLMQLTQEAGIKPKGADAAASKNKVILNKTLMMRVFLCGLSFMMTSPNSAMTSSGG